MRVALYVRVSTEEQAEEGFSIDGQIKNLTDYCERNNYSIIDIYKDEGVSGKSIKGRTALNRLLEDCVSNKFDMVIVWKVSRLARRQVDFVNIIAHFEEYSIAFNSISENIDASTPVGRAMLQMMGSFAELERNTILDNLKMGMKQRASEGKWNGGIVLGYKSQNKKLVIVESEANIVKHIFELYLSGKGYKAIANQLNHEGFQTKKGKAFSINSVRQILLNSVYVGYISFNKLENWSEKRRKGKNPNSIYVKGEHEPIITEETWQKVQDRINQRSNKPAKTFTGHFPLTTLLRCPVCGQGMIGHRLKNSNGDVLRYYQCGNFHYKGSAVCKSNMIRADYAEAEVLDRIEQVVRDKSVLKEILERVNAKIANYKKPLQEKLDYNQEQITRIETNLNKYMKLFESDRISSTTVINKIHELEDELSKLKTASHNIKADLLKPSIKEVPFDRVSNILSSFSKILPKAEPEKQKSLLHSIISKITINPSNNIKERTIKDIELYFDLNDKNDYVLTYGTAPPY